MKLNLLKTINSPNDLKQLAPTKLNQLAEEIRHFLIKTVSQTGGHLASNLGVVELSMALHYCFNSPTDKIVWDVGHQSYIHKILTGRKSQMNKLRKLGGMSGFPKTSESPHDSFDVGHAGTSISAALGLCKARDILGENHSVIAVIGDGSLSCGLAFEGLNNAGRSNTNLIVVLNDNEMSISENVGALSKHLTALRTDPSYINLKQNIHSALKHLPAGGMLDTLLKGAKEGLKHLLVEGSFFGELGFNYIPPVDGNNIEELIEVFNRVKKLQGPVLVHVYTKKGKGYKPAEECPHLYHGVSSFEPATGRTKPQKPSYSEAFGSAVLRLAERNDRLVCITAAMPAGTGLTRFAEKYPNRLYDVGISESHAVTFAAGLAKQGIVPVIAMYSTFLQRAYDQLMHDVCLQNLPVVLAVDRAGLVAGDGETHQGVFDLSFMSHLPNMTILCPSSAEELGAMLEYAVSLGTPVAIRYPKAEVPSEQVTSPIETGKWEILSDENKVLIAVGALLTQAKNIRRLLNEQGTDIGLINARFVKPIADECVKSLEGKTVFVYEENSAIGGYAAFLRHRLTELNVTCKLYEFAVPDRFLPTASRDELLEICGLDEAALVKRISEVIGT